MKRALAADAVPPSRGAVLALLEDRLPAAPTDVLRICVAFGVDLDVVLKDSVPSCGAVLAVVGDAEVLRQCDLAVVRAPWDAAPVLGGFPVARVYPLRDATVVRLGGCVTWIDRATGSLQNLSGFQGYAFGHALHCTVRTTRHDALLELRAGDRVLDAVHTRVRSRVWTLAMDDHEVWLCNPIVIECYPIRDGRFQSRLPFDAHHTDYRSAALHGGRLYLTDGLSLDSLERGNPGAALDSHATRDDLLWGAELHASENYLHVVTPHAHMRFQ